MTEFQIDPTSFAPAGDAIDAVGADLQARWEQLKAQSLAVHFGQHDDVAPLIQMSLMSAIEIADECFGSSTEELVAFSDGLRTTGEIYGAAEDDTLSAVHEQPVPEG